MVLQSMVLRPRARMKFLPRLNALSPELRRKGALMKTQQANRSAAGVVVSTSQQRADALVSHGPCNPDGGVTSIWRSRPVVSVLVPLSWRSSAPLLGTPPSSCVNHLVSSCVSYQGGRCPIRNRLFAE